MSLVTPSKTSIAKSFSSEKKREIAYSMDLLIPGVYIWVGSFAIRLWGSVPDDNPYKYPGQLNSRYGFAVILPGYRMFTTYKKSYDPRFTRSR